MHRFAVILLSLCLLVLPGLSFAQGVSAILTWDPVTTLEDGSPLPAGAVVSYIVYAGSTENNMVEKARTDKVEIPLSGLSLSKTDVWLGVAATTSKHLNSAITMIKTVRVSAVLKLNLIHEVSP